LELAVEGILSISRDRMSARLAPAAMTYGGLQAWDAEGTQLAAHLEARRGVLAVHVDITDAHAPITIDPVLVHHEVITFSGPTPQPPLGGVGNGIGEIDDDGLDDFVPSVEADPAALDPAQVHISLGAYYASLQDLDSADAVLLGSVVDDKFGGSVASADDVNNDGFGDLIIGSSNASGTRVFSGAAYILHGSPSGVSGGIAADVPDLRAYGDNPDDAFGAAVAGLGNVHGDGFGDVAVSAPNDDDDGTNFGNLFVMHGSVSGIPAGSANDEYASRLMGRQTNTHFGSVIGAVDDLNRDGYADMIIGAPGYDAPKPGWDFPSKRAASLESTAATRVSTAAPSARMTSTTSRVGSDTVPQ
jgi:hypothetical protein